MTAVIFCAGVFITCSHRWIEPILAFAVRMIQPKQLLTRKHTVKMSHESHHVLMSDPHTIPNRKNNPQLTIYVLLHVESFDDLLTELSLLVTDMMIFSLQRSTSKNIFMKAFPAKQQL